MLNLVDLQRKLCRFQTTYDIGGFGPYCLKKNKHFTEFTFMTPIKA